MFDAFGPVASRPVASVPASSGVIIYTVASGYAQFGGYSYTITYSFPANRITWIGAEVLHPGQPSARLTWTGLEVLHPGQPSARLTWVGIEVLRSIATGGGDDGFISILW